jgi:hypothetical protein
VLLGTARRRHGVPLWPQIGRYPHLAQRRAPEAREDILDKGTAFDSGTEAERAEASQPSRFTATSLGELLDVLRRFNAVDSSLSPPAERRPASEAGQD